MKKIVLSYDFGGARNQLSELATIFKIAPHDQDELKNRINKVFELSKTYIDNLKMTNIFADAIDIDFGEILFFLFKKKDMLRKILKSSISIL